MSLFNRPAWAKSQTSDAEESEGNIFSHSRAYQDIVADEQRTKKAKLEQQKLKLERRSSAKHEVKQERDGAPLKRRRITSEEGLGLLNESGLFAEPITIDDEDVQRSGDEGSVFARRTSPRFKKHADGGQESPSKRQAAVTEFQDDAGEDEDDLLVVPPSAPRQAEEVQEESDDELADLVRQARERGKPREPHAKHSQTPELGAHSPLNDVEYRNPGRIGLPTPPPLDPTIQLFISSRIPESKPLIVHRKLSQSLQAIRKVWCSKQGFSDGFSNQVYLIYRMRRVYDVTTCRSLGLDVDQAGDVVMKGAHGKKGVDRVHLEAVTDEIFAELKAEKTREERKKVGDVEEEEAQSGAEAKEQAEEEPMIRLIFKVKGHPKPYKLKVKPVSARQRIFVECRKGTDCLIDYRLRKGHDGLQDQLRPRQESITVPRV